MVYLLATFKLFISLFVYIQLATPSARETEKKKILCGYITTINNIDSVAKKEKENWY